KLSRTPAERVEADVGGDPAKPGSQRASPLVAGQRLPGPDHRLLKGILGVVKRAQQPLALGVEGRPVPLDQAPECLLVALPSGCQQRLLTGESGCGGAGHALDGAVAGPRLASWAPPRPIPSVSSKPSVPGRAVDENRPVAGSVAPRRNLRRGRP